MAATLDEISESEEANYMFWTERAAMFLGLYRQNKDRLNKIGFRNAIRDRREMRFFGDDNG